MKYRKKNGAFSLIEVMVALAIIAILTTFILPQVRDQIAKSKDTKAVTTLNSFRVASQLYQLDNTSQVLIAKDKLAAYDDTATTQALKKLLPYLDAKAKKVVDNNGAIEVGGSQTEEDKKVVYGGKVRLTFVNKNKNEADGYSLWLEPVEGTGEKDTRGNKWMDY